MLILGGNSNKNISWVKKAEKEFKEFYNVKGIYYNHWYNEEELNIDKELNKNIKIIEIPGNFHFYGNMEVIKLIINRFLKDNL